MLADSLLEAARTLCIALDPLVFTAPVTHVYNPLRYAEPVYAAYLARFASGPKRMVFLGMNPGPFGMAQTGVPFGEVAAVRDFLGLAGEVGLPSAVHPKRPVAGFGCMRSEVSGARLWGAVARRFGTADAFFARNMVMNYCPLSFMEAGGRNRTPDQLPAAERQALYAACDAHLRTVIEVLAPEWVIGIGQFAEGRAKIALAGMDVRIARISHPSPASPAANRGWETLVDGELQALGVCPL